jgi:hypothetical protein
MHKAEIKRLVGKVEQRGFTLVPLNLHYKGGRVKAEIALAKGKAEHDKRDTEKKRDWERLEKGQLMRHKVQGPRCVSDSLALSSKRTVDAARNNRPQGPRRVSDSLAFSSKGPVDAARNNGPQGPRCVSDSLALSSKRTVDAARNNGPQGLRRAATHWRFSTMSAAETQGLKQALTTPVRCRPSGRRRLPGRSQTGPACRH